eukprot:gnl/Carplike_NY0171/7222_a9969_183.p1 GENE.gnl/Carplike_NY0171/7222_a9969_183~~gnl/Carplike_NY0171/7222_a9969_183.p1  ORF type:complete len:558 (+),score=160.58 gnl/Carplike_NY0171/7222_a9969_183:249-1922(+)
MGNDCTGACRNHRITWKRQGAGQIRTKIGFAANNDTITEHFGIVKRGEQPPSFPDEEEDEEDGDEEFEEEEEESEEEWIDVDDEEFELEEDDSYIHSSSGKRRSSRIKSDKKSQKKHSSGKKTTNKKNKPKRKPTKGQSKTVKPVSVTSDDDTPRSLFNPLSFSTFGAPVIIFDEVDGLSGGDRGGAGAIGKMIDETNVPIILICNDKYNDKVKTLLRRAVDIVFRKPTAAAAKKRITQIAESQGLEFGPGVVESLIEGTGHDIRQILNTIEVWALDVPEGSTKKIGTGDARKALEIAGKSINVNSFEIVPRAFAHGTAKKPYYERASEYFEDDIRGDFMFENYPKVFPSAPTKETECFRRYLAADSFSRANVFQQLIYSEQAWSLMPSVALCSYVLPAFYMRGAMRSRVDFPAILGKTSKEGASFRKLRSVVMAPLYTSLHSQDAKDFVCDNASQITTSVLHDAASILDISNKKERSEKIKGYAKKLVASGMDKEMLDEMVEMNCTFSRLQRPKGQKKSSFATVLTSGQKRMLTSALNSASKAFEEVKSKGRKSRK